MSVSERHQIVRLSYFSSVKYKELVQSHGLPLPVNTNSAFLEAAITPKLGVWREAVAVILRVLTEKGSYHFMLGFRELYVPHVTAASNSYPYTMKQTMLCIITTHLLRSFFTPV